MLKFYISEKAVEPASQHADLNFSTDMDINIKILIRKTVINNMADPLRPIENQIPSLTEAPINIPLLTIID